MLKKTLCFAATAVMCAAMLPAADNNGDGAKKEYEKYEGGFTLGASLNNGRNNDADFFLTAGYFNRYFLFDFGFNFQRINFFGNNSNLWSFASHLGGRACLYRNLYFTGGAFGMTTNKKTMWGPHHPFAVGLFTGLDYQISRHFLLSAKVYAFNYDRRANGNKFYEVFETGSLGVSYVF